MIYQRKSQRNRHIFLVADNGHIRAPEFFQEAWNHPIYSKEWREAIRREWRSLINKKVFRFEILPGGRKAVKARWLFKVKMKRGLIDKFMARLVAGGYSQIPGVDFHETYSPVMKYASLRVLLAIAVQKGKKLIRSILTQHTLMRI